MSIPLVFFDELIVISLLKSPSIVFPVMMRDEGSAFIL